MPFKTSTGVFNHASRERYVDDRGTGSRYISMMEYFLSTGRIPVNYLNLSSNENGKRKAQDGLEFVEFEKLIQGTEIKIKEK